LSVRTFRCRYKPLYIDGNLHTLAAKGFIRAKHIDNWATIKKRLPPNLREIQSAQCITNLYVRNVNEEDEDDEVNEEEEEVNEESEQEEEDEDELNEKSEEEDEDEESEVNELNEESKVNELNEESEVNEVKEEEDAEDEDTDDTEVNTGLQRLEGNENETDGVFSWEHK